MANIVAYIIFIGRLFDVVSLFFLYFTDMTPTAPLLDAAGDAV
jgi:hypothetical protein